MPSEPYDQAFYQEQSGGSLHSARIILSQVMAMLKPQRVLDVGCGVGTWLRAALDLGVPDVVGIDGDYVDPSALQVDRRQFIAADISRTAIPAALGPQNDHRFDLIICMEVAEHLPFERSRSFIEELTAISDVVLFSAAVPFQFGEHHFNEQWPEFWALLFREQGFTCFDCLRDTVWSDPGVEWWYAQNTFIFARKHSAAAALLPIESLAETAGLARVHPKNFLVNLLSLPRRYRQQAAAEEFIDFDTLQTAYARSEQMPSALAAISRANAAPADAIDVFPWTRMEIYEPEREIAELKKRLWDTGEYLSAAEHSYAKAREEITTHVSVRLRAEQKYAEAQNQIAYQFGQIDDLYAERSRLEYERSALEDQLELARQARDVVAQSEPVIPKPPDAEDRLAQLLRRMTSRIPQPVRRAIGASLRTVRRGHRGRPQIVMSAPLLETTVQAVVIETAISPIIEAPNPTITAEIGMAVEQAPLRRWGEAYGTVSYATLAKGIKRLRRFDLFNEKDYLARNLDVDEGGYDPYQHFIQAGAFEERGRIDPEELARVMGDLTLAGHMTKAAPLADVSAVLTALVAKIPHIGIYVSSCGNMFMEEIASDLARDLRSVGSQADVRDETSSINDRPPVCLFVAPHEFFTLGAGPKWVREDVLSRAFMFGTEQVQTKWFNIALPFMLMSRGVLDICSQTAMIFGEASVPALHVLPGSRQRPPELTTNDRQHPLFRILMPEAKFDPDPARAFKARPIDINFFGNGSPRRNRFFVRNAEFFSEYETFLYCRNAERGPLLGRGQESALTRIAAHVSGHSKITLNIHRDEMGFFEWHRMVRLGMCSGSVVVSDPCLPHPDFIAGQHYFQEQSRHIPDLLEWLLKTEDGAQAAEKIRANVDDLITNVFDTRRTMTELLRFLAQHTDSQ